METLASAGANKKLFGAPQRSKHLLYKTIEDAQGISKWLTKCRLRLFSSSYDTKKTIQVSTGIRSSFSALLFQLATRRCNHRDCRKTYEGSWRGLRYVQNITKTKNGMCVLLWLGKVVNRDIWSNKSHPQDYTCELPVRKLAPFCHWLAWDLSIKWYIRILHLTFHFAFHFPFQISHFISRFIPLLIPLMYINIKIEGKNWISGCPLVVVRKNTALLLTLL